MWKMYKIVFLVIAAALAQESNACCCVSREPFMTSTCLECLYGLYPGCSPVPPCCSCFKDITKPITHQPPCCNCIYFPEVEYPCTNLVKPFYYNTCFCSCGCCA